MINQNSISISILNWKQYEKNAKNEEINDNNWGTHIDSFITNQTSSSISGVVNILNDNKIYTKGGLILLKINADDLNKKEDLKYDITFEYNIKLYC